MWISLINPRNLKIAGAALVIIFIAGFCVYINKKLNDNYNSIRELESTNKNLNDQLSNQNEEIKTKDKFIITNQATIVRKNNNRAVPDDNIIKWLRLNRCEACK